jgi:hypothetical protein
MFVRTIGTPGFPSPSFLPLDLSVSGSIVAATLVIDPSIPRTPAFRVERSTLPVDGGGP